MPTQRGLSNRKRQGRGRKNNPVVIVCGLEPDPKRHWLRTLWKRRPQDVDAFAQYIRQNHPHMLPKDVQNVAEYVRCMLRGLF